MKQLVFILAFFMVFVQISCVMADKGADLYASGDYMGSIAWYQDAVKQTSGTEQAPLLNNIGTAYVALNQPNEAAKYYGKAVEADPAYGRGYINLGVVQEKLKQPDEALTSYGKVSTADPALYAEALVKKGTLLSGQGKLDEALAAFHEAESGAKGSVVVDLYTAIGGIEFTKKNTQAAEEAFRKAIDAAPDDAALAWTNLGVLKITQNQYDAAREAFETAIQHDPSGKTKAASYLKNLEGMTAKKNTSS